jgi:hypothetical protein
VKILEHFVTGTMSSSPSNAPSFGMIDFAMVIAAADSPCGTRHIGVSSESSVRTHVSDYVSQRGQKSKTTYWEGLHAFECHGGG